MVSDEPIEGRCNARAGENAEGYCEHYPKKDDVGEPINGRCRMHGGDGNSGPPTGSANGLKHGVRADPTNLRSHLETGEEEFLEQLVGSWIDVAPFGPDHPAVERLEVLAVKAIQERRGEGEILNEIAVDQPVGVSDEGKPVTRMDEHYLARFTSRLSKDIRMGLKDLGCLPDPQTAQAAATRSAAEILADAVDRASSDGSDA